VCGPARASQSKYSLNSPSRRRSLLEEETPVTVHEGRYGGMGMEEPVNRYAHWHLKDQGALSLFPSLHIPHVCARKRWAHDSTHCLRCVTRGSSIPQDARWLPTARPPAFKLRADLCGIPFSLAFILLLVSTCCAVRPNGFFTLRVRWAGVRVRPL
jgi:hypothetical protein